MKKMIINNDEDCELFCKTLQCAINKFVDANVNNLDVVSRTKFKTWIKKRGANERKNAEKSI